MRLKLQRIEENLHRNKIGIWEWSSEEEDNVSHEDD
jgi:hypothetical protein